MCRVLSLLKLMHETENLENLENFDLNDQNLRFFEILRSLIKRTKLFYNASKKLYKIMKYPFSQSVKNNQTLVISLGSLENS